jgi:hypothetical protein
VNADIAQYISITPCPNIITANEARRDQNLMWGNEVRGSTKLVTWLSCRIKFRHRQIHQSDRYAFSLPDAASDTAAGVIFGVDLLVINGTIGPPASNHGLISAMTKFHMIQAERNGNTKPRGKLMITARHFAKFHNLIVSRLMVNVGQQRTETTPSLHIDL